MLADFQQTTICKTISLINLSWISNESIDYKIKSRTLPHQVWDPFSTIHDSFHAILFYILSPMAVGSGCNLIYYTISHASCESATVTTVNLPSLRQWFQRARKVDMHAYAGSLFICAHVYTITEYSTFAWSRWTQKILHRQYCHDEGKYHRRQVSPVYISSNFIFTYSTHSKCTRSQSQNSLVVPTWKTISGRRTFHYRASVLWNNLPPKLCVNLDILSVNEFKNAIAL